MGFFAKIKRALKTKKVVYEDLESIAYYYGDMLHRDFGPAIRTPQSDQWFQFDNRHRIGGPAVIYKNGEVEYWLNDVQYSEGEYWNFSRSSKKRIDSDNTIRYGYLQFSRSLGRNEFIFHRIDGPACIKNKDFWFCLNGKSLSIKEWAALLKIDPVTYKALEKSK